MVGGQSIFMWILRCEGFKVFKVFRVFKDFKDLKDFISLRI